MGRGGGRERKESGSSVHGLDSDLFARLLVARVVFGIEGARAFNTRSAFWRGRYVLQLVCGKE